jgi:hypothetical protein
MLQLHFLALQLGGLGVLAFILSPPDYRRARLASIMPILLEGAVRGQAIAVG